MINATRGKARCMRVDELARKDVRAAKGKGQTGLSLARAARAQTAAVGKQVQEHKIETPTQQVLEDNTDRQTGTDMHARARTHACTMHARTPTYERGALLEQKQVRERIQRVGSLHEQKMEKTKQESGAGVTKNPTHDDRAACPIKSVYACMRVGRASIASRYTSGTRQVGAHSS